MMSDLSSSPLRAPTATPAVVLEVKGLKVRYGPIEAVHGIDFSVRQGEIVCLIGANGAGKTSTLLAVSGALQPSAGTVTFGGLKIHNLPGHRIAAMGLAHVPEGRRIFPRMTVWENLAMGTYAKKTLPSDQDLAMVFDLFPALKEREGQLGGTLSGGEQQMLAFARALVARPQLLLLDEPSMGLSPRLVARVFAVIAEINQRGRGVSILLVEQNARMALRTADRAYVLESGSVVLSGMARNLLDSDSVRAAYLGGSLGGPTPPSPDLT
jgi:branched-chain amino acid transport system ATP-binding protein